MLSREEGKSNSTFRVAATLPPKALDQNLDLA
jgi:hypothetical protein